MQSTSNSEAAFPRQHAYDTPILGPRSQRAPSVTPRARRAAFWASLAALPVSSSVIAHAITQRKLRGLGFGAGAALGLGVVRWQLQRHFTEDADYVVERKTQGLEIRRYATHRVAEVDIDADNFRSAMHDGFGALADYVFDNRIAMTVPVTTSRSDRRDASTMPLRPDPQFVRSGPGRFTMRFVLPESVTLEGAPSPKDARVHVREIAEHRVAALRFTGRMNERNIEAANRTITESMRHALLTGRGEAIVASYDPPWTLPLLRRNELWIKLA